MPRTKAKPSDRKANKAELIRKTAASLGSNVRPRDIVAAMKQRGITVGYTQIAKALRAKRFKATGGSTNAKETNGAATQVNKAQRIRDIAKMLGNRVRPRDIIAELAKEGITVSSAQVSTTLRAAGYRRKRRGRRAGAAVSAHSTLNGSLNLDALIAAKVFAAKVGGMAAAEAALSAIKKLS
jgi:lambda repressor-like predicted transcriptional regulator